ncbi:MAG: ATP-binding protein [Thermodesulfobacteriota bacterium]
MMKEDDYKANEGDHPAGYYLDIIDAVRDPLLVISPEMSCMHMNRAAREIIQVDEESYKNRPCFEMVRDFDSSCWGKGEECPVRDALESGEVVRAIKKMAVHSSLERSYEISAVPLKNESGEITAVVEVLHDITASLDHMELKEITAKIEQAKREWEATMDCVQDFVVLLDSQGCIKRLNKPLADFTGLPFSKVLGQQFDTFLASQNFEPDQNVKDSTVAEFFHAPSSCSFSMRSYPLTTDDEEMQVVTLHDISQRKFASAQLEEKNNALHEAFAELKTTQAHLLQQEKMASVGQLAAGVAHEINNPVGFVTSNINTMGKYLDKVAEFIAIQNKFVSKYCPDESKVKTLKEYARKMKIDFIVDDVKDLVSESLDGVERVKNIVMNLKNFSRVDQAERALVNINECLDDTINIAWNELKYKCIMDKRYGELPLTKCYPQQLNQVFMNLLVNAAQAIDKQGEVTIKTWFADGSIFVTITDSGCGIPADKVSRIFEPFFTTKDVGQGTGLGLSISYDIIVNKHDGKITVASEQGKGTTFTIALPVIEE